MMNGQTKYDIYVQWNVLSLKKKKKEIKGTLTQAITQMNLEDIMLSKPVTKGQMGFSRQEDWSGLLFSSPGNLLSPGIKPAFLALQADSSSLSRLGSPYQRRVSNNSDRTWQFLTPPVKFFLGMLFVWYKTCYLSLFHAFCFQFINLIYHHPLKDHFPCP